MYLKLKQTIESLARLTVSEERKEVLNPLVIYIQEKVGIHEEIRLNFICTHNSRRSHLSQIWAQTMANYFAVNNVFSYSGGTEKTAVFSKVVETIEGNGFKVIKITDGDNPVYAIKYSDNEPAVICFSKKFNDDFNPKSNYIAVMTCSSADEGCPIVMGAEKRFSIKYEDPKLFDYTELMGKKYLERSLEIASEMYYVFSKVKNEK